MSNNDRVVAFDDVMIRSLSLTSFDIFSSNFVQELISGRGGLRMQIHEYICQITTELWPLIDVKISFLLSIFRFFLQVSFKLCKKSCYRQRVVWDCGCINLYKYVQSYGP